MTEAGWRPEEPLDFEAIPVPTEVDQTFKSDAYHPLSHRINGQNRRVKQQTHRSEDVEQQTHRSEDVGRALFYRSPLSLDYTGGRATPPPRRRRVSSTNALLAVSELVATWKVSPLPAWALEALEESKAGPLLSREVTVTAWGVSAVNTGVGGHPSRFQ